MIANTFINRPNTAIVIALIIVIIGVVSIVTLPVSQYPEITPPVVQVSANYVGADAQTVEETVATPIESQVNGVPGMAYMQSNSTNTGSMSLSVTFDLGTNVDIAALDVENRVNTAMPILPAEVKNLGISLRKRTPSILMVIGIYSPNGTHDIKFIDNYTNIFIRDAILRVKGVGDVFARADDFGMRIWLNPDKMANLGLTTGDVIQAVQQQNVQVAAGVVGSTPQATTQAFEYTAFVEGRLTSETEFGNIIVKVNPSDGSIVHMKDVARVELGKFSYSGNSYVDGKPSAFLLVFQLPGSNALETANGIYSQMATIAKSFPPDLNYNIPFEAVSVVKVSIQEVVKTLLIALSLVVIVVFIFLQTWKATLIPILAIPVSIIGTFAFFGPLGFTVNTLTLFGLVMAIGIVVDDAIIVVEAIQRYIDEEHLPPKEAAFRAMQDISGPVVAIALILAAVFVPVGFIPGIVGKLYQQFAITIAISVLLSAFVALTLTPALSSLMLTPKTEMRKGVLNRFFGLFNRVFEKGLGRYSKSVRSVINYSRYVIILLLMVIAGTLILFRNKPTSFIPLEDEGRFYLTFELPEAASTTRTVAVLQKIMKTLDNVPEVGHYAAISGLNVVTFATKSNNGTIFCQLKPWDQRKKKSQELSAVIADLNRRFSTLSEARVIVIAPPAIPGLGSTGGFSFILQQRESNDDINEFQNVVMSFMMAANKRPEIASAFTFFTANTPGYRISVDRDKCEKLGVSIGDVFNTLQTYMGSFYINDFTLYGRDFRVLAQADTVFRDRITDINKYYVRNIGGQMLPISDFVSYRVVESAPLISHYNLYRSTEFDGEAAKGYSSGQALQALRETAAAVLPVGYGYEFSGLSREEVEAGSKTILIFSISILFVFLFLTALYESWSVPFSILLAVPLGAFGAILALTFVQKLSDNIYAQIGLVTLIGLAAKNSILIVEFAKRRVDSGMELKAATLEAIRLRLRPILMTSLAFIFGISPLIFARGAGAVARQTIGWTVFGGMLAATFIGIFMVPVLFVVITRISYGKKKLEELQKTGTPGAGTEV
ncbi:MAG: multidrug efflux RND transporter permease subunit [Bacteroidales bacterium]